MRNYFDDLFSQMNSTQRNENDGRKIKWPQTTYYNETMKKRRTCFLFFPLSLSLSLSLCLELFTETPPDQRSHSSTSLFQINLKIRT